MRKYEINRFKIMYTENPEINKMGINYFEIDNMKMFSVGYRDSWIKEDLYSHLILQRIRV